MTVKFRLKRRAAGGAAGAPATLENAELAFNEQDLTLYYGIGTGGAGGSATSIIAIGGSGAFAPINSPAFTGTPTVPTAAVNTNTTQAASTAFVLNQANDTAGTIAMNGTQAAGSSELYSRADHVHPTDTTRAPTANPTFTGTVTIPTPAVDNSSTAAASTAYVQGQKGTATPIIAGTGAAGTSAKWAPIDHVHPNQRIDQLLAPTAAVSFNSQRITNLLDPSSAQDAATRAYVDAATSGQKWLSARLASTATVSETSATATTLPVGGASLNVDGTAVVNGDVVLLKDQTTSARNGAYTVSGVGTSVLLTRIAAMDSASEIDGKVFIIEDGSTQAGTVWITVSEVTTLGTDAIAFTKKSDASDIVPGSGLTMSGLTLNVIGTSNRITANADSIDIAATYVGQTSITTLGTITTGTWTGTAIAAANGGTGQAGGYTTGDILQATGASTLSKLAAVATGNVLISGGVGTASSWGKVGLTTHVSGTLPVANGGTGAVTLTGYVKGTGTAALSASATIPNTDISGLGSMSTQNASAVAITGGTIDGIVFDGGTF